MTKGHYHLQFDNISQSGRSMVEMLGVLAVIGVLSIGGILGYRHAVDKTTANRLMKDVETAYVSVNAGVNRKAGVLTKVDFKPSSGYPMWTELIVDEDFRSDIILAKNVSESVCDMVLDMTENTQWVISSIEADTNYLYQLKECAEENALVFSLDDVSDYTYACEKDCPANMMCNVNDECVCEAGFNTDENGNCIAKECNLTQGPEAQTERFCCESLGGYWNYDTDPEMCGCPEGYFFNGKECAVDNWCSYTLSVPEIVQAYESDCAYELTIPEIVQAYESDCTYDFTVTDTDGVITTTMTPGDKKCASGYCILNWSNNSCSSSVSTYVAGTTTTLYGRCAPFDEYYNVCQNKPNAEVTMTPVAGKTCKNGYCILNWSNETCSSNVGTYGVNTITRIYGRCAPFDEYYNICQNKTGGEVLMTPKRGCYEENTYCSILWGNNMCQGVGTYGTNTTRDLFGVCLKYDGVGDMTCPFKTK